MKKPTVHPDAFVAFNATVRGDVRIEEGASIFTARCCAATARQSRSAPAATFRKLRRACGV